MIDPSGNRRRWPLVAAGIGLATAVAAVATRRRRVSRAIEDYAERVRDQWTTLAATPYDPADVAHLPAPVRRYFERVLTPGQLPIAGATFSQAGEFRLGGADAPWHPFTATQVSSVSPPGYVWDATIDLYPGISARVLDAYVDGEGVLRANLLGAIPVASAGPDPQMNAAELQRYLSEAPWVPTALLPATGVTWEGIDDRRATATIVDGDVSASASFHVDDEGYVRRITADRYRQDTDAIEPWVGEYRAYERRAGIAIPTEAQVGWQGHDGVVPYWRGRLTDCEYRTE